MRRLWSQLVPCSFIFRGSQSFPCVLLSSPLSLTPLFLSLPPIQRMGVMSLPPPFLSPKCRHTHAEKKKSGAPIKHRLFQTTHAFAINLEGSGKEDFFEKSNCQRFEMSDRLPPPPPPPPPLPVSLKQSDACYFLCLPLIFFVTGTGNGGEWRRRCHCLGVCRVG